MEPDFIRLHRSFSNIFKVHAVFSGLMVFTGIDKKPLIRNKPLIKPPAV
jgi:hypothetical protein